MFADSGEKPRKNRRSLSLGRIWGSITVHKPIGCRCVSVDVDIDLKVHFRVVMQLRDLWQ